MHKLMLPRFSFKAVFLITAFLFIAVASVSSRAQEGQPPLRLGIIGLDTSHVIQFTQLLNDPSRPDHVPGARVVLAFKGGSPDIESSATRIDKFTAELQNKWGVKSSIQSRSYVAG
ncbi:MAG: hypothetical protein WKF84_10940 [Pyrinomonadaceae bacterium]